MFGRICTRVFDAARRTFDTVQWRDRMGISVRDANHALGISDALVSAYEQGRYAVSTPIALLRLYVESPGVLVATQLRRTSRSPNRGQRRLCGKPVIATV